MAIKRTNQVKKKKIQTSWKKKLKIWSLRIIGGFFAITIFWVLALKFINPPITWLMIQRGFELQAADKGFKLEKDWLNYEKLSDNLKHAAIA